MSINSIISGTGAYIPKNVIKNTDFLGSTFYRDNGEKMDKPSEAIVAKLEQISGIKERRYVEDHHDTADLAAFAGNQALEDAGLEGNDLDGIIVAHDVGNLVKDEAQAHTIPNLAALVKSRMGITNHRCSALDIMFGCPGWLQGMVLAHHRIACGDAKHIMVIGVDILSRKTDPHDLDTMLFGDGGGATIVSAEESDTKRGIINYQTFSHCENGQTAYINMGKSNNDQYEDGLFLKMQGRQVYRYAVTMVPELVKECLERAGLCLSEVKKFIIHQANEKMIIAMGEKIFEQHGMEGDLEKLIPMTIQNLGNTSVATIPTLLSLMNQGLQGDHKIESGDLVVLASVGAGMHANCMLYRA